MRLIDADELDDVVLDLNQKGWTITRNDYKRIDSILFEFPTVDPVKHGRWERHYSRPNVYADMFWHCSECGYKNEDQWAYRYHKFCPHCGAYMMDEVSE